MYLCVGFGTFSSECCFFFSSRRRHTRCALVTGVQTCALPLFRSVTPSLILKKLSAYRQQNSLAAALREVGRIERTLFTLRWFDDPALRRTVTAELNKGEARNSLARAVAFHRLGRFRDRGLENQQTRAAALNLVTAAI